MRFEEKFARLSSKNNNIPDKKMKFFFKDLFNKCE